MNLLMSWHLFLQVLFIAVGLMMGFHGGRRQSQYILLAAVFAALPVLACVSDVWTVADWLSEDVVSSVASAFGIVVFGTEQLKKVRARAIAPAV